MLAVLLAMFNQLSGINAILYYLNDISRTPDSAAVECELQAVAIGAANLIATVIALRVIDRVRAQETAADWRDGHGAARSWRSR